MSSKFTHQYDMVPIGDLVPIVAFLVPEMDEGVIQYYLLLTLIEFARESRILRREINVETYDNVDEYFLETGDQLEPFRLKDVKLNGVCLARSPDCKCCHGTYSYRSGMLTFCEPLCASDELVLDVILIPSLKACEVDRELTHWPRAILEGFKSFIYSGNDTRWKNMTASTFSLREFKFLASSAGAEYMTGNVSNKIARITR